MKNEHFLKSICSATDYKASEIEWILSKFKQVKFAKNDFLLTEGKTENYYWFLESGFVRSFVNDTNGNIICLGLLFNIIVNALFSAPSPIQKFAFEQPNIAILYFPFSLLPTFIVPIVLLGHLVSIRQLLKSHF